MEPIQILIVVFALFAISRVILQYRKKNINLGEFIFWMIAWIILIIIVTIPALSMFFAKIAGITRGVDLFVYLGIILLFYLAYREYIIINENRRNFSKVVSELSIIRYELEKLKKKSDKRRTSKK